MSNLRMQVSFREITILLLLPIIGACLVTFYKVPYVASIFIFYLGPGLYLDIARNAARILAKHLLFAVTVSVPFAIVIDWVGVVNNTWSVPHSIFPVRIFGILPIEDILWLVAGVFVIVALYDRDGRNDADNLVGRRVRGAVIMGIVILSLFVSLIHFAPYLFAWRTHFTYTVLGFVFVLVPTVLKLFRHDKEVKVSSSVIGWFFCFTLAFELVAAHMRYWVFQGTYLLPDIVLFGSSPIPSEELIFVGVVGPIAAIALYDYFIDSKP